jgi:hypothetical protein
LESLLTRKLLGIGAAAAFLTACTAATSGSGVPSAAAAMQSVSSQARAPLTVTNLSGEYSGTLTDNQMGTGKVKMWLSQDGSGLGGSFVTSGSSSGMNVEIAWTENGDSVGGNSVIIAASGYCTFAMTGKYSSTTHKIRGTYKSSYGCSGEHGSYKFAQKCYYQGTTSDYVRPDSTVKPC